MTVSTLRAFFLFWDGGWAMPTNTEVVRKVGEMKKHDAELAYVVQHLDKLLK